MSLSRTVSVTYRFAHCTVTIDDALERVRTQFNDGPSVFAIPNLDAESIRRARHLGYQEIGDERAVWEMTRWHDLLHTVIAEAEGHAFSPTLHAVAHGDYRLAPGVVEREERLVLFVQRLLASGVEAVLPDRRVVVR